MRRLLLVPLCGIAAVALSTTSLHAQSFCLDDNPAAPSFGVPGPIPGRGAEDPYGLGVPPNWTYGLGLAPSPSLVVAAGFAPQCDGVVMGPGPFPQLPPPDGIYNDALSDDSAQHLTFPNLPIRLRFSVDRITNGLGGALASEFGFNQHPSDIYLSTIYFVHPQNFVGTPGPLGYAGALAAPLPGTSSTTLFADESMYGLMVGPGMILPPGVPAPPIVMGSHDNIDEFDSQFLDVNGDMQNDTWMYFTLYPDEAFMSSLLPADIFDVAPGAGGSPGIPYATQMQIGFHDDHDSIDALVVWDVGIGQGGPAFNGPGAEPGLDYALFSLSPGSGSLQQWGLSSADVFFTDFSGKFFLYAPAGTLAVSHFPGGTPGLDGNVDGLEVDQCPNDLSGNGFVDFADILAIIGNWGPCPAPPTHCPWDLSGNGTVDFADILVVIGGWGPCPA